MYGNHMEMYFLIIQTQPCGSVVYFITVCLSSRTPGSPPAAEERMQRGDGEDTGQQSTVLQVSKAQYNRSVQYSNTGQ